MGKVFHTSNKTITKAYIMDLPVKERPENAKYCKSHQIRVCTICKIYTSYSSMNISMLFYLENMPWGSLWITSAVDILFCSTFLKCKLSYFSTDSYAVTIHWNCLKETIPTKVHNI